MYLDAVRTRKVLPVASIFFADHKRKVRKKPAARVELAAFRSPDLKV